jgi:DNA polymerase-1
MDYRRDSPVHISVMRFSTRREEDPSSLSFFGKQIRVMAHLSSPGYRLYNTYYVKLSGDKTGWHDARYLLAQAKMEMHDPDNNSLYPSNSNTIASLIGQERAISRKNKHSLMLQDLHEPASSSDQQSMLQNSKVSIDTGRLGTESNASSLNISEEKVDVVNGNHSLATAAKEATNAKFTVTMTRSDEQSKLRERLCSIYENILVVDNLSLAEDVAKMLTVNYKHLIHACDTEVYLLTLFSLIFFQFNLH